MNVHLLQSYVDRFYGYGAWEAPLWFIGMEEGGCGTLDEVERRLRNWETRGCMDLEDCCEYHIAMGVEHFFGPKGRLQHTWGKLVRIFLSYVDRPCDTDSVRRFQAQYFGSRSCGFASLEFLPLPSPSISDWIYSEIKGVPYLASREKYKEEVVPRRGKELCRRIAFHKPKCVVIYGISYRNEWENILGKKFDRSDITDIMEAQFEESRIVLVAHPVSRGRTRLYWSGIGQYLKTTNKAPEPTPTSVTPPANESKSK